MKNVKTFTTQIGTDRTFALIGNVTRNDEYASGLDTNADIKATIALCQDVVTQLTSLKLSRAQLNTQIAALDQAIRNITKSYR